MGRKNLQLLIVDPQNDFMDIPGAALPVQGAGADMDRLARLIDAAGSAISGITVTLDSHHSVGVERPAMWRLGNGDPLPPYTEITAAEVRAGEKVPRREEDLAWVLQYLDALEAAGRYKLRVWPVHCETGTWGHNVHDAVRRAYNRWEEATLTPVGKVLKGLNPRTEHYSALQAEVPDATDPETQLKTALIAQLDAGDEIVLAGEASSHCVRATTEHLVDNLPSGQVAKIVLLKDCMSPVAGFEAEADAFLAAMAARGATVTTSEAWLDRLLAVQ